MVLTDTVPDGWTVSTGKLSVRNAVPVQRTEDGAVALYDPFSKKLNVLAGIILPGSSFDKVVIHREGRRGAWADGNQIWLVDLESGNILRTVEGSLFDIFNDITDEGLYFRYSGENEYIYLEWDTAEEVLRSEYGGILSPDGKLLAAGRSIEGFTIVDTGTGEILWESGFNNSNTIYGLAFADNDTLVASHGQVQIYRLSDRKMVFSTGKEHETYGFDMAAGRLVMPLRAGGSMINLMPADEDVALPHAVMETWENFNPENLVITTTMLPLAGNWNGNNIGFFDENGNQITVELDEPGLAYVFENEGYILHPTKGLERPFVYISPDGEWQAMLRNDEVDVFRAKEGPEPVRTIASNNYQRLCAAIYGDLLVLGAYAENLSVYDLTTGECLGTMETGAMCTKIQFSADGKHIITFSAMDEEATVINMENWAVIMKIPVKNAGSVAYTLSIGFSPDGKEAIVLYPDGHAEVGVLAPDLETLVERAREYTAAE